MAASLLKGARLRGGDAAAAGAAGAVAGAAGLRSPRRVLRHALFRGAGSPRWPARWAPRCGWGCSPSSTWSYSTRALVAVRTATAKRRDSCAPRSARRSSLLLFGFARLIRPRAARGARRLTDADLEDAGAAIAAQPSTSPISRVSPRQGAAVQRRSDRRSSCTACRVGPGSRLAIRLGRRRRGRRSHSAVPGALRRFRRRAGLLRNRHDASPSLCRLRADVREAGRGSAGGPDDVHARGQQRRALPPGASAGSRRTAAPFASSTADGVPAIIDRAARGVRRLARSRRPAPRRASRWAFSTRPTWRGFPSASIERSGRIEAFANIWPGRGQVELVARSDALSPRRAQERDGGAVRAPDGLGQGAGLPAGSRSAWRRCPASRARLSPRSGIGSARSCTQHGEAFYNFQGLRAYKEKFTPVWEPHYLAYPGGLRLPRVIADVSALIAGGYRRIFLK